MSAADRGAAARPPSLAALLGPSARPLVGVRRRDLPVGRRRAFEGDPQLSQGAEGSVRHRRALERRRVPARRDAEPDRAARGRLSRRPGGRERAVRGRRKRLARRAAVRAGLAHGRSHGPPSSPRPSSWPRCSRRAGADDGRQRARGRGPVRSARRSRASRTCGRWRCCSQASRSSRPAGRCGPASSPARSPGSWSHVRARPDRTARHEPRLASLRSVFRYYGDAIRDGIDPARSSA